jgi:hypothetical protein
MQAQDLATLTGAPQRCSLLIRRFRGASDHARMPIQGQSRAMGRGIPKTGPLERIEPVLAHSAPGETGSSLQLPLAGRGRA